MRLIDADAAIESLTEYGNGRAVYIGVEEAVRRIEQLPSAQPEQRWVPCSERLPEEREWIGTKMLGTTISNEVFVTFETSDGQRFADHISFQNGKLSRSDEHRMRVVYNGAKPIAWMPLPEPYRERNKDT